MHIKKILIATDLSSGIRAAYPYAKMLANVFRAEIVLLHVDETGEFGVHNTAEMKTFIERTVLVRNQLLEQAQAALSTPTHSVKTVTLDGVPWQEILKCADAENADLVILAKQGMRMFERVLLGSTTSRVLRHSDRPVLVVPATAHDVSPTEMATIRTILATTDFSSESECGLKEAVLWADALDAQVMLTHVLRLPVLVPTVPGETMLFVPQEFQNRLQSDANQQLAQAAQRANSKRVTPLLQVNFAIADAIADEANARADLVVIPSQGKGAIKAALLGSTTETTIKLAKKPVLVLPQAYLNKRYKTM